MANMRTCKECGVPKPLGDFYIYGKDRPGRFRQCKVCMIAKAKANYRANFKAKQAYEKKRFQRPERKAAVVQYQKKRRASHPEKSKARYTAANAIRSGQLERQPCEVCGKENAQAHHPDYSKPLDVQWLCFIHHRMAHGQLAHTQDKQ